MEYQTFNNSSPSSNTSISPANSPGPSSAAGASTQAQHKLLNRMSTLFGGGKKKNDTSTANPAVYYATSNVNNNDSQFADSMFNYEGTASCVDSMYSSLQSRRSNYRPVPNPKTPEPLRTVQLDSPIVHLPTPPPPNAQQNRPSVPPLKDNNQITSRSASPDLALVAGATTRKASPPSSQQHISTSSSFDVGDHSKKQVGIPSDKVEDIEEQFKLLLKEYAPSADHMNNVNNLTFEQKAMLLRSSRSPALLKKNSTFSHVMPSFSLKATFSRNKNKATGATKNGTSKPPLPHNSYNSSPLFDQSALQTNNSSSIYTQSDGKMMNSIKANTAPGRYSRSTRSSLPMGSGHESYGRNKSRSKLKSTPEYFVHYLEETYVRDLEESEVLDLRVFLRSVVVSWTNEFLSQGGYEAISKLLKQMKEAPKRFPNDNKILQHLCKCLKTIMTHEPIGTELVLRNPVAFYHIRDILFGPANKKQKQVYALEISTRSTLLNLLCALATIQTSHCNRAADYVHGYDVLRRLLLDRSSDTNTSSSDTDDKKKSQTKHKSPFPTTLKTDPKEILQMIMENDPNGQAIGGEYKWDKDELKPRYTAWMRELQYTVERHIETITFLAQVLNYDFNSAYRQIHKMRQQQGQQVDYEELYRLSSSSNGETSGAVMTEEGVVDYIVTHLRLIRTVVTTQPTSYVGQYDEREQEKMRLELMLSGFDKIAKILAQCPHPTVRASYINYLSPLMNPCAELPIPDRSATPTSANSNSSLTPSVAQSEASQEQQKPPPLPSRSALKGRDINTSLATAAKADAPPFLGNTGYHHLSDEDNYEVSIYADDVAVDDTLHDYQIQNTDDNNTIRDRQWQYEDEPYYDDIFLDDDEEFTDEQFYSEEYYNDDDEDEDEANTSSDGGNDGQKYYHDQQQRQQQFDDNESILFEREAREFITAKRATANTLLLNNSSAAQRT
ncbi:armadillo-type protein [Mycotypha africana]|uniref:armadillo-type protein n=1 Tax=Mycotypha africana TaxID=64632 RepID=UPI002300EB4F|nr:armadillo-type protein [Mycotypha africana]KAI8975717.1 armadillo-type protein [Mycotypha africana]